MDFESAERTIPEFLLCGDLIACWLAFPLLAIAEELAALPFKARLPSSVIPSTVEAIAEAKAAPAADAVGVVEGGSTCSALALQFSIARSSLNRNSCVWL
ncbi:MAG TPA: hypothetical protein VMU48_06830 [Terracidiphilus sp.]|nr:hypothetical protein [Terracidiphilus sp.]